MILGQKLGQTIWQIRQFVLGRRILESLLVQTSMTRFFSYMSPVLAEWPKSAKLLTFRVTPITGSIWASGSKNDSVSDPKFCTKN